MKNNFITKIIGATLAFAMMIGGAVGINTAKQAKEVSAVGDELAFHFTGASVHGGETNYSSREANVDSASDSKVGAAHWQITVGNNSAQLGTNAKANNLSKTTLGNGSFAAASGIASALSEYTETSISTTTQKYSAAICTTGMEYIQRVDLIFTGTNGGNITTAWVLSSANGTVWEVESAKTSNITTGSSFTFTKNTDSRQYAFVAHWNLTNSGGLKGFELKLYGEYPAAKAVQANSVDIKSGSTTITDSYEPSSAYYLGDTLDLTNSIVNYEQGDDYEDGAGNISWTSSNSDVATVANGVVTFTGAGQSTITGTALDKGLNDSTVYASFVLNLSNIIGGANNPYTIAQAKAAIDANKGKTNVYVAGVVSQVDSYNSTYHSITYWISQNGTTSDQFEVYGGKGIGGADFSAVSDIQVGASVVVKGNITLFSQTYEFSKDNELVSYTYVTRYDISFDSHGGTDVAAQKVIEGGKVTRPADPTKDPEGDYSFTFGGWYTDSECNNAYDFDSIVSSNLTLHAKWISSLIPAKNVIERDLKTDSSLTYRYSIEGDAISDTLNHDLLGVDDSSYTDWTNKSGLSGAVYAGQSAGGDNTSGAAIQLRSKNSNSGIVTTQTGGLARKIILTWNSATANGRTVDVYGKASAYTQATDLYTANTQGTKIGSIVKGTSTQLIITDDYAYIGLRSNEGALYLNSVTIQWGEKTIHYSNVGVRFTGTISTALWQRLDQESTIEGYGIMYAKAEDVDGASIEEWYEEARRDEANVDDTFTPVQDKSYKMVKGLEIKSFYTEITGEKTHPAQDEDLYGWSLFKNVSETDLATPFTAVAYIRTTADEIIFLDEITKSAAQLAQDLIDADNEYDEESLDGSLRNLAIMA